jgi:hypothetical protein
LAHRSSLVVQGGIRRQITENEYTGRSLFFGISAWLTR